MKLTEIVHANAIVPQLQAKDRDDILNIGGFSDTVFDLIGLFATNTHHPRHWVQTIEAINLDNPA